MTQPRFEHLLRASGGTAALFRPRRSAASATARCVRIDVGAVSRAATPRLANFQLGLDQAWFWTAQWQAMERQADEDLAAKSYEDFDTLDAFIDSLERSTEE